MAAKAEDGTNPEVHIWRIAPSRRDLLGFLGWGAVLNSIGVGTLAFVRFMYPRVLFEPPSQFKIGRPTEYAPLSTSEASCGRYSGLNFNSSSAVFVCESRARRLLMTQLATALGFLDCLAIGSK